MGGDEEGFRLLLSKGKEEWGAGRQSLRPRRYLRTGGDCRSKIRCCTYKRIWTHS